MDRVIPIKVLILVVVAVCGVLFGMYKYNEYADKKYWKEVEERSMQLRTKNDKEVDDEILKMTQLFDPDTCMKIMRERVDLETLKKLNRVQERRIQGK